MSFKIKMLLTLVAFIVLSTPLLGQDETLSNADIISMTRAGLGKELIIQKIQSTKCNFDTKTASLIALKTAGVDEKVMSAMLSARADSPKVEPPKAEPPKADPPKADPPKAEPQKADPPKVEPPKPANAKLKTDTNDFADAAPVIATAVKKMAAGFRGKPAGDVRDEFVRSEYANFFAFTFAQALLGDTPGNVVLSKIAPIQYAFETARTDKQIGTSSSSTASATQADKPGFARLLGFAIDNGLIERGVNDSVLTLSTTPGALFTFGSKDYQKAYEEAGIFNKIGLSASFNVTKQDSLLANATRSQLREYSVRYSLFDRSARSKDFQDIFDQRIAPEIQKLLNADVAVANVLNIKPKTTKLQLDTGGALMKGLDALVVTSEYTGATEAVQIEMLEKAILNHLKSAVVTPVRNREIVTEGEENGLKIELQEKLDNLVAVQKKISFDEARKHLDKFYKGQQATFAYINHRDPLGNYSEFKGMYQRYGTVLKPLTLLLNGGISFYHKPNAAINQQKVRDASFAASLEGKIKSPWNEIEDFSPITYSFTGRYSRMYENKGVVNRKADLGSFQFLMNFPVFKGFALPLSVTYSNATEMERKSGVRFNFGFKLDTDKIFELALLNRLLGK